jgi:HEPN domain-containing protein
MAMRPETRLWWEQAKRDLKIAEHNHGSRDYEACVFFCEQAAQKALKALLMHRTDEPLPRIHNLVELGRLAGVDGRMSVFLGQLTPHYMIARYPDAAGAVTTELYDGWMSRRFLLGTKEVLEWCKRRLG